MKWTVLVLALVLSASISGTNAQGCPDGWAEKSARCYQFFMGSMTFSQAEAFCASHNARVALPKDQALNDFIVALRNSNARDAQFPAWIGLRDVDVENEHRWTDGTLLEGYDNWADGEPNDAPGEADCVRIERSDADEQYRNKWRDYPCDSASFGVFCETLSPCEVDKGTCSASGDPHYTSFDNRRHHFQGRCRYTLAKDCGNNEFTVEAKNEPWGTRPVSVTREIYVIAFGITIGILQYDGSNNRHTVTLDTGNGGGPTYLNSPSYVDPLGRITVGVVGRYVHVRLTDQCVDVYFDGRHKVRVNVPRTYMGNMCGLCGNFNDDASDDLNGQSTTVFGNSHLVDISYCPGGDIGPTDDPPTPCDEALDAIVRDNSNCGRITDANGPFAICHNVVDPNDYFENCAFDMCVGGAPDALCQGLEAYADDCAAAGVQLNWRTANLCPLPCPANSEYRSCMTPCPPTCRDQSATCDAPCVEGCECIADHIWSGDSCVPVNQCGCVDPDTGEYFQLNAEWGTPDGEQCRCDEGGIINCDEVPCDVDGGYAWTNVNGVYGCNCIGDCCDRVLCKASGDPHYCTADQRRHHFQGGCTYTFAKDCVGNDFTVETKNVPSPRRPSVSLVRAVWVYITIDNVTWVICILQRRVVRVNDVTRTLPLSLAGGQIDVKLTGRFVRIELVELCVVILYDGRHQVKVEIPRNYQNRLCGLCGNFNGNKNDDYMLPDGSTAPNWNVFGNAWQTDDDCDVDPPTGDPPTLGPCDPQYSDPCDVLTDTSGPFATCIPVVDPTPYVEDCVYDMCQTQTGICSILETYYDTCMEAGVPAFAWRSQDFCPMDCPANSHYSASASACPATCVNPDAPDNCNVFPEFGEGCVCDEGYRQSGQECVPASQCGCIDVYENYYMIGEQWGTEDGQQCECGFPFGPGFPWITCNPATCNEEDGYSWTLVDGVWGCHCVLPCCDRAICYANGDPHYCTPDGRRHHFQGPCRYVFAKDCGNSSDFTVEVQQVPSQWNPAVSIVRQVFVIAYGYEIKIDQGRVVTVTPPGPPPVTPTITLPPPPAMAKIRITQSGRYIRVELIELCVEVLYDGRHEIKVEIPSNYQNDLCGLCGNYNGIPGDDYMLPDGTVASNWNDFGNSWVTDINTCDGDPPTGEPPTLGPCDPNLSDPCEAIRDPSGPFADCHPYLDPEAYYNNCVFDMCHTGESLCENMETYYGFCLQEGSPPFDWRPSIPCPMDCGANSHYSTCTSPCPATCVDPTAPDSCFGECVDAGDNCLQDCVEGCECDEGYIQSGSECVLPVDCGCTDEDGFYHPLGDVWEDDGEECECFADDTIVCEEIDGCDPNPCDPNAACTDVPAPGTGQVCTCNTGYTGDGYTCTDIDGCAGSPCDANADCTDITAPGTGQVCTCNTGYTGDGYTCTDIDGCAGSPCDANADCTDITAPGTGQVCTCNTGYTGDGYTCTDIDGCAGSPCDANADCTDVAAPGTGQVCTCNTGYTGDGYTCTDIDGCAGSPCDANADCADVAAPGTGQVCTCNTGYTGDGYTCTDIDGCAGSPCDANADCTDVAAPGTGQVCTCNTGYTGDGYTCTDIDGCAGSPCDANAACADVAAPGTGQVCTCNTGYTGDGYTCTDIDGCAGSPCDANADCADVAAPGTGQVCTCNTGYTGDGYTCTDIDGCAGSPCDANAACADVTAPGTGQVCTCNTGYTGDGYTCTDIDGCAGSPCDANAACADVAAPGTGQVCTCNTGYTGNGYTCTDTDGCNPDPCVAMATCTDNMAPMTGAVCTCPPGYHGDGKIHGTGCTDISGCDPNPCHILATCEDVPAPGTGAVCICPFGYEGDGTMGGTGCTVIQCSPQSPPSNGAVSGGNSPGDEATFTCDPGYYLVGVNPLVCQAGGTWSDTAPTCVEINGCDPDPCVPMATCEDLPPPETGALCHCPLGYEGDGFMDGTGCTIVQCSPQSPPTNGAVSGGNSYGDLATFTCDPGYYLVGVNPLLCQADGTWSDSAPTCVEINGCDPDPCVPMATCEDLPPPETGALCHCPLGYEGDGFMDGTGCTIVQCSPQSPPTNGGVSGGNSYGDLATFTCDPGYYLVGVNPLVCQADGTWSDSAPTCVEINGCDPDPCVPMATCEDLPPPETGAVCHCPLGYGGDGFMDGTGCTELTRDDLCVMPGRGICRACGDPHFRTFDGKRHHFQGPCRYTFAKDCGNSSDFTVEVQHVPVPRRPVVSVVREVYVIAYGYEIGILQGNEVTVTVNGVTYTATGSIPFELAMGKIQVTYRGIWVHVRLVEYCVDVFYNGRHCVKVRVTPYYWGRMCGLCGDFNGNRANDFMLPDGTIAPNWNDFGHSWLVEDEDDERCVVGPPPPPCPHGLMTVVSANDMCGLIMDHYGPFGVCHDLGVDPQDFFDDCVFDMCARDGDIVGLCENLEAYADACEEAGAIGFTWRSATLCPLPCPPNSHYNPCASPCPATCQNPDAPNQPCITLCVECCECDPGYVMSGPHCVPLEDCGCTDPMTGRYYPLEETWIQNGRRCVCTRNGIVCTECSFDIVFILDRSSSIGPYGMYIAEKYIAYIIRCLHGLDVEVGYIVFDCISKWLISLGLYNVDTTALIPEIKAAEFTGGESRVGNAIYHLMCTANYRNGIPSAAIILTDGVAYEEHPNNLYELQSNAARAMGIELYAVAIGREFLFNLNALANIAGGPDRVFDVYSCCALAIRLLDDLCGPCPPGVDLVSCIQDPCVNAECAAHPTAMCKANYCGGCNAVFYDEQGNKVDCMAMNMYG
ncbi:uncharacterized protein LOC144878174 isoform X2 [Branchiostoma floridae x Branchiostoma japonicum]